MFLRCSWMFHPCSERREHELAPVALLRTAHTKKYICLVCGTCCWPFRASLHALLGRMFQVWSLTPNGRRRTPNADVGEDRTILFFHINKRTDDSVCNISRKEEDGFILNMKEREDDIFRETNRRDDPIFKRIERSFSILFAIQ